MRRWLIVLTVAALAVTLVSMPSSAKENPLPDTVEFTDGEVRYGAIVTRTGEYAGDTVPAPLRPTWDAIGWEHLMDPNFNKCRVTRGSLTWIDKNTALLETFEDCTARLPLPGPTSHHKIVHITKGGALKMSPDWSYPTMWDKVPSLTGCDLNGTFPIYHGHFDGERLYASAHYNGFCDGGTAWSKFGVGAEDGPIHVTYEFELFTD